MTSRPVTGKSRTLFHSAHCLKTVADTLDFGYIDGNEFAPGNLNISNSTTVIRTLLVYLVLFILLSFLLKISKMPASGAVL